MKKSTKIVITIAVVGILITLVTYKLLSNKSEIEERVYYPDVNTEVIVQIDTVKSGVFNQNISFTGAFSSNREVVIGSETSGKVIKVGVQEGSQVKAGQLIAQLDDALIRAQLQSAQANYDKAVNILKRYQQASSGVTQLQIDNSQTDVLTSKAQIEQLKRQIRQYTISAPFSGIIESRKFDLGAIVSPGMEMATLIDISSVKLEINVPEKRISQFQIGQIIEVSTDIYPGMTFKGKVDLIASKADASHNFLIKILVVNVKSSLKSGMYGTIVLNNTLSHDALTIPRSALVGSSLKPQVYVVANGTARLRTIQIGTGNEKRIEVTKGLKNGELVVTGGLINLSDETKVSIAQ